MNRLVVPAREKEVADYRRLVDLAAEQLPLDELDCRREGDFGDPNELAFVYKAPPGKVIRASGRLTTHETDRFGNPIADGAEEFIGRALVYEVFGLDHGVSAHGSSDWRQLPQGQTFASTPNSDRLRPRVQVTIIGRPVVRHTLTSSEPQRLEIEQRRFIYFEHSPVVEVSVQTAMGDLMSMQVEVEDDPTSADLEVADLSFVREVQESLWMPYGAKPVGTTAEKYTSEILGDDIDSVGSEEFTRLKEWFWREFRYHRGRALPDDPYPESARLRLASTIDNEGNNGRLYGPYENYRANSDLGHIDLPDGSKRVVRLMDREELMRRLALQHRLRKTGWLVIGGRG